MNLNFVLVAIIFLILFSCASNKPQSSAAFLFKRWKIDYVEMNGQKLDELACEEGEFEYEFKKNNIYFIYSSKGIDSKGKWEWNSDENCIYLRNNYGEVEGKIVNIEKYRITLIPTPIIGRFPELEIGKFYYIPK